jgi:hypothetical protein
MLSDIPPLSPASAPFSPRRAEASDPALSGGVAPGAGPAPLAARDPFPLGPPPAFSANVIDAQHAVLGDPSRAYRAARDALFRG